MVTENDNNLHCIYSDRKIRGDQISISDTQTMPRQDLSKANEEGRRAAEREQK